MKNGKMTKEAANISSRSSFSFPPGKLQYLHLATSWPNISNATEISNLSVPHICLQLRDLIAWFC